MSNTHAVHCNFTERQVGIYDDEQLPTIDIMIPCYSEPTEIVEMTLRACYEMDYPRHKITCWVCDDGKKDDMKQMVAEVSQDSRGMATRYVARIKTPGVPHHAKAGNLNNCIFNCESSGQLIIVLDCDMLPESCMARTVAPFFFKRKAPKAPKKLVRSTSSSTLALDQQANGSSNATSTSSRSHPGLLAGGHFHSNATVRDDSSTSSESSRSIPGALSQARLTDNSDLVASSSSASSNTDSTTPADMESGASDAGADSPEFDAKAGLLQTPQGNNLQVDHCLVCGAAHTCASLRLYTDMQHA